MDDTELKTILAMRCKEYNEEIHKQHYGILRGPDKTHKVGIQTAYRLAGRNP